MSQALNMPTLAVMFDIKKLEQRFGVGNYLTQAWQVLWRTVDTTDLREWSGTILLEGDTEGKPQGSALLFSHSISLSCANYVRSSHRAASIEMWLISLGSWKGNAQGPSLC